MRQDRNHELRATSRKRSQPSFGRRAEKSTRGGLGRMALFVVFTAAVFATLTAWEPPLGVQLGRRNIRPGRLCEYCLRSLRRSSMC